jgi:hypothetical protein
METNVTVLPTKSAFQSTTNLCTFILPLGLFPSEGNVPSVFPYWQALFYPEWSTVFTNGVSDSSGNNVCTVEGDIVPAEFSPYTNIGVE